MEDGEPFVDFYGILQVNPQCDAKALEAAYRHLAKMYHPDHSETADIEKFAEVIAAYRSLRSPDERARYDLRYAAYTGFEFSPSDDGNSDLRAAISDADAHARILMYLYKRRRECAENAGAGHYAIQEMLNCTDENFGFHMWYLKEKGFIAVTDQGTLAITIVGVDHVIATSRATTEETLRIARAHDPQGPMPS